MSLKEPKGSDYAVLELISLTELLPRSSAVEVRFDKSDTAQMHRIHLLAACMRVARVLGSDQELNLEKTALILINFENGNKGMFLTNARPRSQIAVGFPGSPLDGHYPYVGISYNEDGVKYCVSSGNETTLPWSKDIEDTTFGEDELLGQMTGFLLKFAPRYPEDASFRGIEPTVVFGGDSK
ncbi:MAG: hypothetical protein AB9915_02505 [Candidatus Dojkabacteria bacterium]